MDAGSGRWAALAGFSYLSVGDRETGDGTLEPSAHERFSADLALDYFLTNRSRIGLTAQYVEAQDIQSPLAAGNSVNKPGYDRFYLALALTSFDVGSYFHGTRASIALDTFFQDDDRVLSGASSLQGESDVSRFDLHLEGQLNLFCCHTTFAELTVGWGDLERTETLICVPTFPKPGVPDPELSLARFVDRGASPFAVPGDCVQATNTFEAEEISVVGILQDECHNASWDWTGGLRFDWYSIDDSRPGGSDETNFLVSGAAGLCYHVTQRLSVYTNASGGWRRPTLFELNATEVVDGRVLFGNPDLDPEFHANLEIGTKMAMKDRWALQCALFGHYTDDYIGARGPAPRHRPAAQQRRRHGAGGRRARGLVAALHHHRGPRAAGDPRHHALHRRGRHRRRAPHVAHRGALQRAAARGLPRAPLVRRAGALRRLGQPRRRTWRRRLRDGRPDLRHLLRPPLRPRRLGQLRRHQPARPGVHAGDRPAAGPGPLVLRQRGRGLLQRRDCRAARCAGSLGGCVPPVSSPLWSWAI